MKFIINFTKKNKNKLSLFKSSQYPPSNDITVNDVILEGWLKNFFFFQVKLFCKHASELYLIRGSCIADEYVRTSLDLDLEDPDSFMFYYVILRGLERFLSEFNTYPGQFDDQVEPDAFKLKGIIGKLLSEWNCAHILRDERVHEICKYGGAELHSVSAILGGCAAQEVVKLITHQYIPLNNAFFYDGVTSKSVSFCL